VTIWSETERLQIAIPGVRTIAAAGYRAEYDVALNVTTIGHVVDAALKQGSIRDLAIEDAPLDAVIRALYATSGTAGSSADVAASRNADVAAGLPPSLTLRRTAEASAEVGRARPRERTTP
jgi:hypothetical protein